VAEVVVHVSVTVPGWHCMFQASSLLKAFRSGEMGWVDVAQMFGSSCKKNKRHVCNQIISIVSLITTATGSVKVLETINFK